MEIETSKRWSRIVAPLLVLAAPVLLLAAVTATEAPTGFDNQTNGSQPQAQMDADRAQFEKVQQISDGLGPVFNAASCAECHSNPVSGGITQLTELRAGSFDGTTFTAHPGGSLIFERAIDPAIQVRPVDRDNVIALRTVNNTLGDGFVEVISDATFFDIQTQQPPAARGTTIRVPVLEAPGAMAIGRFGWKNQRATLLSFAADAYSNEMGITSPLFPNENTSNGNDVSVFNTINGVPALQDPPDAGNPFGQAVGAFARFLRATKAPPRDAGAAATRDAQVGARIFSQVGCDVCHTPTITTAAPGTVLAGGSVIVPPALGSQIIHPFSDFMLHDVGTGDGIVQNGGAATMNMLRTPPLWGMRTRTRLMHDGLSQTPNQAIVRHAGQASSSVSGWQLLNRRQKNQLVRFMNSL